MRSSFRPLLLLAGIVLAGAPFTHADTINLSISELASGTLGNQSFTNQAVTFTDSFTTQLFAACQADGSCVDNTFPDQYDLATYQGLVTTINVGGIGTFDANSGDNFIQFTYSDGSLVTIVPFNGGDTTGLLTFPTDPSFLGPSCVDNLPFASDCPVYASTTAGDLILTSVADTYTTSTDITSSSPVPETSTLTLLATGTLGILELLRRRQRPA